MMLLVWLGVPLPPLFWSDRLILQKKARSFASSTNLR